MDIKKITQAQFEALKAAGALSEKEIKSFETRMAKEVNKPEAQSLKEEVQTVCYQGQGYQAGFFSRNQVGRDGKSYVSTWARFGRSQSAYPVTENLKVYAMGLLDHIQAMEAQGFKFREPTKD
jgi:hypothetical protein